MYPLEANRKYAHSNKTLIVQTLNSGRVHPDILTVHVRIPIPQSKSN